MLSPNEFCDFIQIGKYPLNVPDPPTAATFLNNVSEYTYMDEYPNFDWFMIADPLDIASKIISEILPTVMDS